jgi:type I restriction enzyme S subunit
MSGSVGHKRITKEFIEETLIPLIPIAHQKKLVSNIDNLFSQSQTLKKVSQNKISELFLLKRSILKQAFNGELVKAA